MTTTTIFEANPTMGSFMLPGMSSPEPMEASLGRVVRFDNECVLIPDPNQRTKLPLVLTKSYSLPLWKKKGNQLSDSDAEDGAAGTSTVRAPSPEESRARVVIKVPIPLFRRRTSRSPTPRGRSVSTSPVIPKALPPCLVHRSPSTSAGNTQLSPVRRPSQPGYHRQKDELTVPLRPCCEACEHITDQSRKEGEHWQEKFSRGARRRRSASLENNDFRREPDKFSHTRTNSFRNEFFALSKSLDVESSRYAAPSTFSLTVDEVDKRRKSLDFSQDASSSSCPTHVSPSPSLYSGGARYPRHAPHERDVSSSSTLSSTSTADDIVPEGVDPRARLRSSPIEEEDEAQLFPLPSPRRSPSGTPSPSPSPRISPAPSPNGSTSCLPAGLSSSKDSHSPSKSNSSQESLLKASLSRKQAGAHLAAPTLSASRSTVQSGNTDGLFSDSSPAAVTALRSPASLTTTGVSTERGLRIRIAPRSGDRIAVGSMSPKGPRPPNNIRDTPSQEEDANELFPLSTSSQSRAPVIDSPSSPPAAPPSPVLPLRLTTVSIKPVVGFPTSAPIPIPASPKTPTHGRHVPGPSSAQHVQNGHQHSVSQSSVASTSPNTPISPVGTQRRKLSFTRPFIKAGEAIRDASVDVLKGVSSMSSGGVVGSV
ncbi:hypothetical protein M413DRAFT_29621 [Hebeloma cylindrosporum]|uniref:Uncharacterized protein n=1 Tax=Hebeloma cylindrosporum TaxID=76867 RepID=A0A0C2YDE0_HEBCY|nr:hypothetical protein M413DRAFT_29621 [Hebeloma cylindrosporum h7]